MTILPKVIYRFNAIPNKLQMCFPPRTRTKNFLICMEVQNLKFVYCTLTSQRERDWSWKNQGSWLQITVQATVNKNEEKI